MNTFLWVLQILLIPALSPLFVGVIRKIKAKCQNRDGAAIWQPYYDLNKLFHKDEIISQDASWIFRFAPYLVISVTIIIGAIIPIFATFFNPIITSDILSIIYLVALGTFFLALSGIDVGSPFGGFGSSREMTVASLTEASLLFSFLVLAFFAKSTNLFSIINHTTALSPTDWAAFILAFSSFVIVMLAETARFPFDNPATHLELTMIHEAMILEYSGKRLALMEWAAANKLLIFLSLGANLFFPWHIATTPSFIAIMIGIGFWLGKSLIFATFIALLESSIAKYRFFRLPGLLSTALILDLIALTLIL